MRFLLTFLGLFTPLAWLLWIMAGDTPVSPTLETDPPEFGSEPVLDTSEIPQLPVRGEIQRLEKGLFQRFHPEQNYVVYYVSFRGIERVNDKARIVGISCAVFGEPKDGRENLRARMEAPYLEGDPVALIAAQREGARELVLGGGVKVYDELGRLMAELERVEINLETDTVTADGDVYFRSPKKGAEVRGRGLECDFAFTSARLLHDVRARLPLGDSAVTLACEGPAIVVRDAAKKKTTVTLENAARIEHQDVAGACDSIIAHLFDSEESGEVEVEKVVLEGAVVFELDASLAEGLEEFRAHRITINGETEIVVEGGEDPVRAVRRGPLEVFGLADRVLDFDAPSIVIRLRPDAKERKNSLESILFPSGLNIRDREGPGKLHAGWLRYDARAGHLEAKREVVASGVGRRLEADRIELRRPPDRKDTVVLGVFGAKSLELRATGKLGPLARGKENRYTFSCDGPLYVESHKTTVAVRATKRVRVKGRTETFLECGQIFVVIVDKSLRLVDAQGAIRATDPETRATLRAQQLTFRSDQESEILLRGNPVVVEQADRIFEGHVVTYKEDGEFVASEGIRADVTLKGERWEFRADSAEGIAPKEPGAPPRFLAWGEVSVKGPQGATLHADRVFYLNKTGQLTLDGKPARIRLGEQFSYEGKQLVLVLEQKGKEFVLVRARTAGPATMVVAPQKKKGGPERVARWEIKLGGDAWLEGNTVRSANPTVVRGFDEKGGLLVSGRADDVRVEVERAPRGLVPKKLVCSKSLELEIFKGRRREWRLVAHSLTYVVNSRNLDLQGPGKLWRENQKDPTTFSEAEFELLDEGVNLKYLGALKGSGR